jgi:hypothetical protein
MTPIQYIQIAVDDEFEAKYTRNLVKTYLFKSLLINPDTKSQYTNFQIGCMIGVDRQKVSDYLFHMKVYNEKARNNQFLTSQFETKFSDVKKACEAYVYECMVQRHRESIKRSRESLQRAKLLNLKMFNFN